MKVFKKAFYYLFAMPAALLALIGAIWGFIKFFFMFGRDSVQERLLIAVNQMKMAEEFRKQNDEINEDGAI